MEFARAKDGRRLYSKEFKAKVIQELEQGFTPAELARRYEIPVLVIIKWKHSARRIDLRAEADKAPEKTDPMVPLSEYRKLLEENKKLKRSLADMAVDRDILKDAVDIATKKKWI